MELGGVPLLYRKSPGLVQLFRCAHRPDFEKDGQIVLRPFSTLEVPDLSLPTLGGMQSFCAMELFGMIRKYAVNCYPTSRRRRRRSLTLYASCTRT